MSNDYYDIFKRKKAQITNGKLELNRTIMMLYMKKDNSLLKVKTKILNKINNISYYTNGDFNRPRPRRNSINK